METQQIYVCSCDNFDEDSNNLVLYFKMSEIILEILRCQEIYDSQVTIISNIFILLDVTKMYVSTEYVSLDP